MLTFEEQEKIIYESARELKLDAHISHMYKSNNHSNGATMLMDYKKDKPYKSSYLFCDRLDVNFYFNSNDKACASMSARWSYNDTDLTENRIDKAVDFIKKMTTLMQEKAENIAKRGIN